MTGSSSSSLIYKARTDSYSIPKLYFTALFDNQSYSPEELLRLYKNNINLLQDIYLFMLAQGDYVDVEGDFLIKFLAIDNTWLERYSRIVWESVKDRNKEIAYQFKCLLESKDFLRYFDYLLYNSPEGIDSLEFNNTFGNVLEEIENDTITRDRLQQWVNHIVEKESRSKYIYTIFEFVCYLDNGIKRRALEIFLKNNSDFEVFNKLSLFQSSGLVVKTLIPHGRIK